VDEYLVWEPEDFDGVEELVVSPSKIWLPDIGIDNRLTNHINIQSYFSPLMVFDLRFSFKLDTLLRF